MAAQTETRRSKCITNGRFRHERFGNILKRDISTVGDWYDKTNFYLSSLRDYMIGLLQNVHRSTKIDIYTEIPVYCGLEKTDRRLDVLVYIREVAYVLIEFKTTNAYSKNVYKPAAAHINQLTDTSINFCNNVLKYYSTHKPIVERIDSQADFIGLLVTKKYKDPQSWTALNQKKTNANRCQTPVDGTVEVVRNRLPVVLVNEFVNYQLRNAFIPNRLNPRLGNGASRGLSGNYRLKRQTTEEIQTS